MSIVERAMRKLQTQTTKSAPAKQMNGNESADAGSSLLGQSQPVASQSIARGIGHGLRARSCTQTIQIDRVALRTAGLLPPEHQERLIADQFRQIKRPLIANAVVKGAEEIQRGNLIMVASALPGEGKTFTSLNLAMSLARERDLDIVLVDADVAKPHISTVLGVNSRVGLLDCLADETLDVGSLLVGTDVERLSILPAGKRAENATELLASSRMRAISSALVAGNPNCIVLFDSPPLLLTSESRVLSEVVGQVVLVVRAGATSHQAVLDAVGVLAEGSSVGLVLNQSEAEDGGRYYGYGYGSDQNSDRASADGARPLQSNQ